MWREEGGLETDKAVKARFWCLFEPFLIYQSLRWFRSHFLGQSPYTVLKFSLLAHAVEAASAGGPTLEDMMRAWNK